MSEHNTDAEPTVSVAGNVMTQADAPQEGIVPQVVQADERLTKEELKSLLVELIAEVKAERLTEELAADLKAELNSAKNDFLVAVARVEQALENASRKD